MWGVIPDHAMQMLSYNKQHFSTEANSSVVYEFGKGMAFLT